MLFRRDPAGHVISGGTLMVMLYRRDHADYVINDDPAGGYVI